ncbi:MAG: hypothetical protein K6B71_01370 [Alphaproteobacteria bacterium]|nr:hypothetical protein [Alphaproteobacteria bacterium]
MNKPYVVALGAKTFVITTNPYKMIVLDRSNDKTLKREYNHPDEIKGIDKTDFIFARAVNNIWSK